MQFRKCLMGMKGNRQAAVARISTTRPIYLYLNIVYGSEYNNILNIIHDCLADKEGKGDVTAMTVLSRPYN